MTYLYLCTKAVDVHRFQPSLHLEVLFREQTLRSSSSRARHHRPLKITVPKKIQL